MTPMDSKSSALSDFANQKHVSHGTRPVDVTGWTCVDASEVVWLIWEVWEIWVFAAAERERGDNAKP